MNLASERFRKSLCIDLRWIDSSGVGVYIKGIMPGLVDNLRDVLIIGMGDCSRLAEFPWSQSKNVTLVDCRAKRYSMAEQFKLPLAMPPKIDLFFSPYYTIPFFYRGKVAVTVHDLSHLVVSEIIDNPLKHAYARMMYRHLSRNAAVIFTVSQFSKNEFLRLMDTPRTQDILVTHLGISPEWYEAYKLPQMRSRPYFVCVGNIKPYKNVGRLVKAFLKVQDRIPHDLVIIGQSEGLITGESPEFFALVRSGGDRIHLTGMVSQQELLALVGHAQCLVMPSLYEGFGLPPVEAMAAGVPVAVARAASLPEVCGDAALYFDPLQIDDMAEKLVTIAMDSEKVEGLREKGLQRSKMFTWPSCSRETAAGLRASLELGKYEQMFI